MNVIGLRAEDKSKWERRVAVVPAQVATLTSAGVDVVVQRSETRCFPHDAYVDAGARIVESIEDADLVIAVKEFPIRTIHGGKAYLSFSHTIKGQPYNMKMLEHVMEVGATMLDHELIVNDDGLRLVAFGSFAGYAGALETLVALGQRLAAQGHATPLAELRPPHAYDGLDAAKAALREVGRAIARDGLPEAVAPLIVGVLGYGKVGAGVETMLDALGVTWKSPAELARLGADPRKQIYAASYRESDMARRRDGGKFNLQEFYDQPELYHSKLAESLPGLSVLFNAIFWAPQYPVYVPNELLRVLQADGRLRLQVIGDITCDIEGSVQATYKATDPGAPCYTYYPDRHAWKDGVQPDGVTIQACDILPCEFPVEASLEFSQALAPFLDALSKADFSAEAPDQAGLPPPIERSVIVWRGNLLPRFDYLREALEG